MRNTRNIAQIGQDHGACEPAIEWAKSCTDLADVWRQATPERLLWIACRPGVLAADTLRRFAIWLLANTPPTSAEIRQRIEGCLDGSDRLTYPVEISRERWAVTALLSRGEIQGRTSNPTQTRAWQAAYLRKIAPQPFVEENPQ